MKTESWYIQRIYTLWDPILFTIVLTLKFMYKLLVDVFKMYICNMGTTVAQWLRCCATYWEVTGSIPYGVTGIFH